jgi:hypothetical protein
MTDDTPTDEHYQEMDFEREDLAPKPIGDEMKGDVADAKAANDLSLTTLFLFRREAAVRPVISNCYARRAIGGRETRCSQLVLPTLPKGLT